MTTPSTTEEVTAKIPALATLMSMGWKYLSPSECSRLRGGNKAVVLKSVLIEDLKKRRFEYKGQTYPLPPNCIDQIVRDLTSPAMQEGLLTANERLYHSLTLGITVTEFIEGKKIFKTIPIIDWNQPENNSFLVTEEMEVLATDGTFHRTPDIVCFVNGLPLVIIEAKRPISGNPNRCMVKEGISQNIRNQKHGEIPNLFAYSQLLFSISGTKGSYGTTMTPAKFWTTWREEEFSEKEFALIKNKKLPLKEQDKMLTHRTNSVQKHFKKLWSNTQLVTEQDRLLISLLSKERLLEFIRYFILFDKKAGKIATRHQQAFGIKALLRQITQIDHEGKRQGGVIWHTTGSGKSFTMVFLCKALLLNEELAQCRILSVTDRIDLEKQLAKTFLTGGAFGVKGTGKKNEENQYKASTGKDLAKRISKGDERILFSIVNKFNTATKLPECYNPSENLIVLVDEGHRSHSGETHERMKKALPNAAFIAFTGTPLLKNDKTTNKFGPIIHAYTMQQAVEDKTVSPLLYEERRPLLDINESAIDEWFEKMTLGLSDKQKSDLKMKYGKKGQIYRSANRIDLIAWDIAIHFVENFKKFGKDLKGQLATDSKLSAIRYKKALDATEHITSAIIISPPDTREGHEDVNEAEIPEVQQWWEDAIKAKFDGDIQEYERQTLEAFSEPGAPDIIIVVDKLLTGFDEPQNAVLYIDKPLKEHSIIQAIARVNRLHEEKQNGLLIDYRGVLEELDIAVKKYQDLADRTQGGFDIEDLEGLYHEVSTEYKRLPALHENLLSIFSSVINREDREQYRQLLLPKMEVDKNGESFDVNQKVREDFYEALTQFGLCLKVALGTRSFFEDSSVTEAQIRIYKRDLKFFSELRIQARMDAQETVDFSSYEKQIRKLVDKQVIGTRVKEPSGVYMVNKLGKKEKAKNWSEEKLRNETDLIRSRITKTIEQDLVDDPYAKIYFSKLLRQAIEEAEAQFNHSFKQYALFSELEEQLEKKEIKDIPGELTAHKHASAYFGLLKLKTKKDTIEKKEQAFINLCMEMDRIVTDAVAENSLNPQNIEAEIRKQLLPLLYKDLGLDVANEVVEEVLSIMRIGLKRGEF